MILYGTVELFWILLSVFHSSPFFLSMYNTLWKFCTFISLGSIYLAVDARSSYGTRNDVFTTWMGISKISYSGATATTTAVTRTPQWSD